MKRTAGISTPRIAVTAARWLLGIVFTVSALGKIADPSAFATNVAAYRIVPSQLINLFAIVMPWVELLTGLSLLNGMLSRGAALLAAVMNVVFVGAAISAIARGLDISCGCFTAAESTVGWGLIGRDLILLAMAIVCYRYAEENGDARSMNHE